MPIYEFDELSNEITVCELNYGTTTDEIEHTWWMDNNVYSLNKTGKDIFVGEGTVVIPSYTYTTITELNMENVLEGYLDEGLYVTTLVCVIGVHLRAFKNIVQVLEVYEAWEQHSIFKKEVKKMYIVKMRLFHIESEKEFDLYKSMNNDIAISEDTVTFFDITGDSVACTSGDCPSFANAYIRKPIISANSNGRIVPLIAVTTEGIKTTYANEFMRIIDFHNLLKIFEETTKRFL